MKTPEERTPRCPPPPHPSGPLLSPRAEPRARTPSSGGSRSAHRPPRSSHPGRGGSVPAHPQHGAVAAASRRGGGRTAAPGSDRDTPNNPRPHSPPHCYSQCSFWGRSPPPLLWPRVPPRAHVTRSHPTGGGPGAVTDGAVLPQQNGQFYPLHGAPRNPPLLPPPPQHPTAVRLSPPPRRPPTWGCPHRGKRRR